MLHNFRKEKWLQQDTTKLKRKNILEKGFRGKKENGNKNKLQKENTYVWPI